MLIKSQNGKQIINLDNSVSVNCDEDNHIVATYPIERAWADLGTYSSETKAQKVLDWILDCYNMNLLIQSPIFKVARDLFDEYVADQKFGIFEMPTDEEVEV